MGRMTAEPDSPTFAPEVARKFRADSARGMILLLTISFPPPLPAQQSGPDDQPLFATHDVLALTLEADFDQLKKDRDQESEEREGRIILTDAGEGQLIPSRPCENQRELQAPTGQCSFPPLRLNFPGEGLEGTILEGQDKLKLVTHCRDNESTTSRTFLEEYLAYRIYNLFTPLSLQARLARVTYVDSRGEDDPVTMMAIVLEDDSLMAARVEGVMVDPPPRGG